MIQEPPYFSIVVPTYNRPAQLAACLQALSQLDYPLDRFEVIVVDDGSKTPQEPVAAPFQSRFNLLILTQQNSGCGAARNAGAARARGDFLVFTDDDAMLTPDSLSKLALRFAIAPDHLIGGRMINSLLDNPFSTASQLLIDYLYAYYNADTTRATFLTGNNMALPTRSFHELRGFLTALRISTEDREICDRWLHHGFSITYAPEVIGYHAHRLTFSSFWRQHFRYGRGAFHFHQVRLSRGQPRVRREPGKFYLDMFRFPSRRKCGHRSLPLALLLIKSQVANAAGFFWEWLIWSADRGRGQCR